MATFCRALWEALPRYSPKQAEHAHVREWIHFYHFAQQEACMEKLNNLYKVTSLKAKQRLSP